VNIHGPSNLVPLTQSIPPYWTPMRTMFATRIANVDTDEAPAVLRERPPLPSADRIQRPLLIPQGANGPRAKQAGSEQLVQAMQAKSIPVTYILFPEEGHGFARPENNLAFYAAAEEFLGACLGGRVEPVGNDLTGSSITVPSGLELLPGLKAAFDARR